MKIKKMLTRFIAEAMHKKPLKKELIGTLSDIVGMYVPSGHEDELIAHSITVLRHSGFEVKMDTTKNVIASRGKLGDGDKLVCINAHTDTVQRAADENVADYVFYDWVRDVFHTNERAMIGGDDKCGVALALTLAAHTNLPMKIILTSGEEIGSVGAEALDPKELDDVAFTFTIDRMHGNDLISEYCGLVLAPDTFVQKFISMSDDIGVKFKETYGSYADTYVLCQYAPAVNLSSGYYNPHSKEDFIVVDELYDVMMAVKNAIEHKPDLEFAIAQAPMDWQTDSYASTVSYGGKYTVYGGGGARSRAGASTMDYYRGMSRKERRKLRKKCKLEFGDKYGFDDKDPRKHRVPTHQESVDQLIEAYADGAIYDDEWDMMLEDGTLAKAEYHMGIDEKIAREKYTQAFDEGYMGGKSQEEIAGLQELLDEDAEEEEFERSLDKSRKQQISSSVFSPGDSLEWNHRSLRELGIASGYLDGTMEDIIFIEYVTGQISYQDLISDLSAKVIDRWLFESCLGARTDFVAMNMPKGERQKWVQVEPTVVIKQKHKKTPVRDELASFGLLSGYDIGAMEDDVFVEYVSGKMTDYDLMENVKDGLDRDFARTCKYARQDFLDLLELSGRDKDDFTKEREFLRKKIAVVKKKPKTLCRSADGYLVETDEDEPNEYDECIKERMRPPYRKDDGDCRGN
jgi:di/tripeptidase